MTNSQALTTYQNYTTRCFAGGTTSQREAAALAFARGVEAQEGIAVMVYAGDDEHRVDMHDWPDDKGFGPWFDEAMSRHGVEIYD